MDHKFKVGEKVNITMEDCWDATTGIITKIDADSKDGYGAYLVENKNPAFLGWLNEDQISKLGN